MSQKKKWSSAAKLKIALEATKEDRTVADLVKLHQFAGLSLGQAANILGVSRRTADRYWAYARAWLYQEISEAEKPPSC